MSQRPPTPSKPRRSRAEQAGYGLRFASQTLLLLVGVGSIIFGLLFIFEIVETKDKLVSGAGLIASGIFAIILVSEKT